MLVIHLMAWISNYLKLPGIWILSDYFIQYSDYRLNAGTRHLKSRLSEYWTSQNWRFEWFHNLNVRHSDPHCILLTQCHRYMIQIVIQKLSKCNNHAAMKKKKISKLAILYFMYYKVFVQIFIHPRRLNRYRGGGQEYRIHSVSNDRPQFWFLMAFWFRMASHFVLFSRVFDKMAAILLRFKMIWNILFRFPMFLNKMAAILFLFTIVWTNQNRTFKKHSDFECIWNFNVQYSSPHLLLWAHFDSWSYLRGPFDGPTFFPMHTYATEIW